MKQFRKKQKRLKKTMNIMLIITAVFLVVYIGAEPYAGKYLGSAAAIAIGYVCDALIIASLCILFVYYSKYSKSDAFLSGIEDEIDDAGYYYTAREEKNPDDYQKAVLADLAKNGFAVSGNVEIDGLEFSAVARKGKDIFYVVTLDEVDKNDVVAYLQSAIYDILNVTIKRRANCVLLYICRSADDDAVALSKAVTCMGKKNQIVFANAIAELESGRCYFLGNSPTKCQQMTANYVMNCDVPIKKEYIADEKLPFQSELEKKMEDFDLTKFKNGEFTVH